jgi:hypothetical protein
LPTTLAATRAAAPLGLAAAPEHLSENAADDLIEQTHMRFSPVSMNGRDGAPKP